ncbi:MAG: hypothetical protein H6811_10940 [Phycisphaeraceae bacterium]|nr:hypothetical protein [Phycisphaeraceae bacterium]
MMGVLKRTAMRTIAATSLALGSAAHGAVADIGQGALKVLQVPMRTDGPKSLDPAAGSTVYDNMACCQFYETLLENKYADPLDMEPRLLAEIPTTDDGGLTWNFKLKPGVRFHDDPCFPGGRGRAIRSDDVFYSIKRLATRAGAKNWWLLEGAIVGLDAWRDSTGMTDSPDFDAPVAGFIKRSDAEFQIRLTEPVYRFMYVLSMFQTSVVAREAVETYGKNFFQHPVGTGPFILDTWVPQQSLTANRNPNYHEVRYPARDEWSREDQRMRLHRPAGQLVPFVDRIEFTMYVPDQPLWLDFGAGKLGYIMVPAPMFDLAINRRTNELNSEFADRGVTHQSDLLLDFIFRGFNMEDPLVGGYSSEKKALRQAISLAVDWQEFNESNYMGQAYIYDGPIPPGLDGHPEGGRAPLTYRGPNLALAAEKLAEAGYPGGQGLDPIKYFTDQSDESRKMTETFKKQMARIGVTIDPQYVDFSTLIDNVNNKRAPMFAFAWSSDYPDGENNLALFYGPYESPGSNHYNYKRAEYDRMYEQIRTMPPSDERTAIYETMRDMLIEDTPYLGSMARTRHYLIAPWMLNTRVTERYWGWFKYVDVDDSKRPS